MNRVGVECQAKERSTPASRYERAATHFRLLCAGISPAAVPTLRSVRQAEWVAAK